MFFTSGRQEARSQVRPHQVQRRIRLQVCTAALPRQNVFTNPLRLTCPQRQGAGLCRQVEISPCSSMPLHLTSRSPLPCAHTQNSSRFGFNGALCNATAAAGARRNQPRVCEILTAHAEQGAAVLQAFADDFSCMTPLQTLMLVSDAQACRRVDRFSRHGSMSRDVVLQGWSRVCCRTS